MACKLLAHGWGTQGNINSRCNLLRNSTGRENIVADRVRTIAGGTSLISYMYEGLYMCKRKQHQVIISFVFDCVTTVLHITTPMSGTQNLACVL